MNLPKANQRLAVYGPTGSGKTVWCEAMLLRYDNVIKIDFKHHLHARPKIDMVVKDIKGLLKASRQQERDGERAIIYQVPRDHLLADNARHLDAIPDLAMLRGNTLLYYDDVVYVASSTDFQRRAPNFYYALTVGRGKGVGVWCCSQRPARIPVSVHTESDCRVTFNLRRNADRKMVEESFGSDAIPWETLRTNRFSFVYGDDQRITQPMKLSLKNGDALDVA